MESLVIFRCSFFFKEVTKPLPLLSSLNDQLWFAEKGREREGEETKTGGHGSELTSGQEQPGQM